MSTPQAARLRLANLMQQVDDAEDAERKALAAVEAAKVAQEATSVAVSYVYSAVAGTSTAPVANTAPVQASVSAPLLVNESNHAEEMQYQPEEHPQAKIQATEQLRANQPIQSASAFGNGWDKRIWVMAILGGLVLFMITMMSRDWFSNLADVEGTADGLFRFGWVVFGTFAGFNAGGWYGASSLPKQRTYHFKEAS